MREENKENVERKKIERLLRIVGEKRENRILFKEKEKEMSAKDTLKA